jgi:chromosome segregation ATPase
MSGCKHGHIGFCSECSREQEVATLKAEIGNREGEKQEMREVIDRLKAELDACKLLRDNYSSRFERLMSEVENLTAERGHYKAGWEGCKAELKQERERNAGLVEALRNVRTVYHYGEKRYGEIESLIDKALQSAAKLDEGNG